MPLLDLLLAMFWFFLFVIWIWLLITVFIDIFRSDMSGVAKALWVLFVIVVPLLGVLVYLIVQGDNMRERSMQKAEEQQAATQQYIQNVAGTSSADEIAKLADLKDKGVLTDDEFQAKKAQLLA